MSGSSARYTIGEHLHVRPIIVSRQQPGAFRDDAEVSAQKKERHPAPSRGRMPKRQEMKNRQNRQGITPGSDTAW